MNRIILTNKRKRIINDIENCIINYCDKFNCILIINFFLNIDYINYIYNNDEIFSFSMKVNNKKYNYKIVFNNNKFVLKLNIKNNG